MKKSFYHWLGLLGLAFGLIGPLAVTNAQVGRTAVGRTTGGGGLSAGSANTWTASQTFNDDIKLILGTGSDSAIEYDTVQTPDGLTIGVGQDSRTLWIKEEGDAADYGLAQQTNPTLCMHSAATTANQYVCLAHDGTNGVVSTGTGAVNFSAAALFSSTVQLGGTSTAFPVASWNAAQTVDTLTLGLGTTSRHLVIHEAGDEAFDFAHGQATHPTLFIHSANQNTAQWLSLTHNGTNGVINAGTGQINITGSGTQINGFIDVGTASSLRIRDAQAQTPDSAILGVGTAGRSILLAETGDEGFDFQHPQQTHPTFYIQTSNQSTTEYAGYTAFGVQSEMFKTLTESAATSAVRVSVAAAGMVGGVLNYTIVASDGTDHQSRSGLIRFAVVNKAATETCGMTNNAGTADASITETEDGNASAISSGTLTYAITCDTTPTNGVDFQINAVSSLTQTTLRVYYSITVNGPGVVTPQ